MGAVITLTSDLGLADGYVAAMKGVILSLNPETTLVDISHQIQPQDIHGAAFILHTVHSLFPLGTIHLVVVDPGVGTERRALILKTPRAFFVAPDNGVLSYILTGHAAPVGNGYQVKLSQEFKAYVINNSDYWRQPVSSTFHGRDIFAPIAARLSLDMPPASLGQIVDTVTAFPISTAVRDGNVITGKVLNVDSFGNLISNIREADLSAKDRPITIRVAGQQISQISRAYVGKNELIALVGSNGYLEIAFPGSSAAKLLHVQAGEPVIIVQGNEG